MPLRTVLMIWGLRLVMRGRGRGGGRVLIVYRALVHLRSGHRQAERQR